MKDEYPQEYFLKLENNNYFIGRITLNLINNQYAAEIDIVHAESKKIYQHIAMIYQLCDKDEAIDRAVQALSNSLKKEIK